MYSPSYSATILSQSRRAVCDVSNELTVFCKTLINSIINKNMNSLTFTTLWANSEDILKYFTHFYHKAGMTLHAFFVSLGENKYEISKPILMEKQEKTIFLPSILSIKVLCFNASYNHSKYLDISPLYHTYPKV